MTKKDKIIIIIPCYNAEKYWAELMPLLSQEKYPDFDLEILVVDNNSEDSSVSYLKDYYPNIKIIENIKNVGYVGANNIGYEYARRKQADYIFLLNQDTVIKAGFLQPLYNFAKDNKFGSLQPKIKLWPKTDKINTIGNAIHFLGFGYGIDSNKTDDNRQGINKINYASGAGVFLSMNVLNKKGYLFDESMFMYLEDLDLGWSLSLMGYDNYLIPDSIIFHKYEFKRGMKQLYWFERNRHWTMLKNYKLGTLLLITPACLIMEIGQLIFALLNKRLLQKLRSYLWLLAPWQIAKLISQRRKIQKKRKRKDREIVKDFKGVILFQPLESPILKIANFFMAIYWYIIKHIIFW